MIQKIIQYFGLIWDDAEALQTLAQQSKPKVVVDTTGLDPRTTQIANILAQRIGRLPEDKLEKLLAILDDE